MADIRVTRTKADILGATTPNIRVTRAKADILGTPTQSDFRIYRTVLFALVQEAPIQQSSNGLTFSQSLTASFPKSLSETVTFSQNITSSFPIVVSQALTFTQAIALVSPAAIEQTVSFSQAANNPQLFADSLSQTVIFSQVLSVLKPEIVSQTATFSQTAGAGLIIPGGVVKSSSGTVTFLQAASKVLLLAGATSYSETHTLSFTQLVTFPQFYNLQQAVIFTDSVSQEKGWNVSQTVTFSDDFNIAGSTWPRTVAQTLTFSHAFVAEKDVDLCGYSPVIGNTTDPNAPAAPPKTFAAVTKESVVTMFYPKVTPTTTIVIRAPEYGDRHRLLFDRINRESRGGSLEIFSDPTWPKLEILEASFTGLKETEAQAILDFFKLTLGLEVGFTDWHGRTWHGIVTTPDTQLIRARRGIVDLSFEFEGEVQ